MTSESDSHKWLTWRRGVTLAVGALAFVCFTIAGALYPGGCYNPLRQMLSALGEIEVNGVRYPACHYWFMAGMLLSAASVGMVWLALARRLTGWHRIFVCLGGVINVAGLCAIALVPFGVNGAMHNSGCTMAIAGGTTVLVSTLRERADFIWLAWFSLVVVFFVIAINVKAIPFNPFATATQKVLILSFATWAGWVAWSAP